MLKFAVLKYKGHVLVYCKNLANLHLAYLKTSLKSQSDFFMTLYRGEQF